MATKANRGTKRQCQNDECNAPFYDLNRETITCPVCGSGFAALPIVDFRPEAAWITAPRAPRPSFYARKPALTAEEPAPEAETDEEPANAEAPDAELPAAEAETLLELEEEADATPIAVGIDDEKA